MRLPEAKAQSKVSYKPEHDLEQILEKDVYPAFLAACLNQSAIAQAPVSIVIAAFSSPKSSPKP